MKVRRTDHKRTVGQLPRSAAYAKGVRLVGRRMYDGIEMIHRHEREANRRRIYNELVKIHERKQRSKNTDHEEDTD